MHISHSNLVMQALIWLHMDQFIAMCFDTIQFSAPYANLRRPDIFKHQIYGENLVLHLSKFGICDFTKVSYHM